MAIRFASLTEANAPAVRALVMSMWAPHASGPLADDLFDWRYRARPVGDTELAFDGERCIAIIDSLIRPYLYEGRIIDVRETCDWFCLPEYRPLGIGTALIRRFMARPEPIFSIGGSKQTHAILQRLKWQRLAAVREYVLPLKARMFAGWSLRGLKLGDGMIGSWLPAAVPFRSLHGARRPRPGARVEPIAERRSASDPLPVGYAVAELLGENDRLWLSAAPGLIGPLIGLQFVIDGAPIGISLCRVEPYLFGRAGKILHLQIASDLRPVIDWIIAETTQRLIDEHAEIAFCRASCPKIAQALHDAGFFSVQSRAAYWWPARKAAPSGLTHFTYLRADDAVPFDQLGRACQASRRSAAGGTYKFARNEVGQDLDG